MLAAGDSEPLSPDGLRRAPPFVDARPLKAAAQSQLPPGNPLRESILGLRDRIPRAEFLAQAAVLVRLAFIAEEQSALAVQVRSGTEAVHVALESARTTALGLDRRART